eukprot:283176_1
MIDYVTLLKVSLKQKKLDYITDILIREGFSLQDLMDNWTRADLVEALRDLSNNQNQPPIPISSLDRNKFAKTVFEFHNKNEVQNTKLILIGQEEQDAIDVIENGQQYMARLVIKMEESLRDLQTNKEKMKHVLHSLCNEIEKEMNDRIDDIYNQQLKTSMKQINAVRIAAKKTDKFHSQYKVYFGDDDRKNKLLHASHFVSNSIEVHKPFGDAMQKRKHDMTITMDKERMKKCFVC